MVIDQIAPQNRVTVSDLQIAFDSESSAHTRYLAYAAKADSEGFHRAASLFRAIASSEQIHAINHACVIRKLGGEPEAQLHTVEVKTTLENLVAALEDKVYEIDSMYPHFLVDNRSAVNSAARTFTWVFEAEKTQAQLLSEEIMRIETESADSSADASVDFFVRPVCGYVSSIPEPERCWDCDRYCATFQTVR
jgi:rubrerythrin